MVSGENIEYIAPESKSLAHTLLYFLTGYESKIVSGEDMKNAEMYAKAESSNLKFKMRNIKKNLEITISPLNEQNWERLKSYTKELDSGKLWNLDKSLKDARAYESFLYGRQYVINEEKKEITLKTKILTNNTRALKSSFIHSVVKPFLYMV